MKFFFLFLMVILFVTAGATIGRAQDDTANLKFLVVKDYNGKPIRNASVVLHPVDPKGNQERGGYEVKTDVDGKTGFDGVPYGKLRIQVLATGYQTFGDDYNIDQPDMQITIRMKRPQGQYSIYSDQQNTKKDDKKDDKKEEPPPQKN
ncbi:MAG TPA: carboxypeptidase-like regulatory domain-containing protein [Terriglobales bacterium]|nr:carboxypeptidase-like regulatory domain-containing protein [Terriglobales bacterium]